MLTAFLLNSVGSRKLWFEEFSDHTVLQCLRCSLKPHSPISWTSTHRLQTFMSKQYEKKGQRMESSINAFKQESHVVKT